MSETNSTNDTKSTRNVISFKDLGVAFLSNGVDGVRSAINGIQTSKSTHQKAIDHLKAGGKDTSAYETFVSANFGANSPNSGTGTRGRTPPKVGDSRLYKTQKVDRTGPFIRLPLDTLGRTKGQPVKVEFRDGSILITPANATEAVAVEDEADAEVLAPSTLVIVNDDEPAIIVDLNDAALAD